MRDLTKDHDAHDRLRISALVAGDLDGADRAAAEEQVRSCAECARLAADLRTVAVSLGSMTVPPRPRDFRLSKRDLGGSRTRGRWSMEGVRRALRPAGTALAALGVAGLLLAGTTALGGLASFGSSGAAAPAAAPPRDANFEARPSGGAAGAVASPAAAAATGAAQPARGASSPAPSPAAPGVLGVPSPSPSGAAGGAATADKSTDLRRQAGPIPPAAPPAGPSPLVVASVALLAAGIGFIVASRFLRPRGDRPD